MLLKVKSEVFTMSSKAICGLTPCYLSDPISTNFLLAYLALATLALLVLKHTKPAPVSGPLHCCLEALPSYLPKVFPHFLSISTPTRLM